MFEFYEYFVDRAENYNELDIDHEEDIIPPVQRLNYQEFLEKIESFETNRGKESNIT